MLRFGLFALALVLAIQSNALAILVEYRETYSSGTANWGNSNSLLTAPTHVTSGGPTGTGDAYISAAKTFSAAATGQVIFRGQDGFNSSSDNFVGDWATVTHLRFWVRHDASVPLRVGARIAESDNSPAYNIMYQTAVPANTWTLVALPISNVDTVDYDVTVEGAPSDFATVLAATGNVQILAQKESLGTGSVVNFSLDNPQIVPEPSTWALAIIGGVALLTLGARRLRDHSRQAAF